MIDYIETKDSPAYVRFLTVSVEDPAASRTHGHYVGRDIDLALITPPASNGDVFKIEIGQWMQNMQQDVQNNRLPAAWRDKYLDSYTKWKSGQEIPLEGTSIKGWGMLSPTQQELLVSMMILTVEDLSRITDVHIQKIGMGAIDLRTKAKAWLAQLQDKGPLTLENAQLKQTLAMQQATIEELTAQLALVVPAPLPHAGSPPPAPPEFDLLETPEPLKGSRKR